MWYQYSFFLQFHWAIVNTRNLTCVYRSIDRVTNRWGSCWMNLFLCRRCCRSLRGGYRRFFNREKALFSGRLLILRTGRWGWRWTVFYIFLGCRKEQRWSRGSTHFWKLWRTCGRSVWYHVFRWILKNRLWWCGRLRLLWWEYRYRGRELKITWIRSEFFAFSMDCLLCRQLLAVYFWWDPNWN